MYNINNWYWNVGEFTNKVYSSAAIKYVALTDTSYQAWITSGNQATNIANGEDLYSVLSEQWLPNYLGNGVILHSTGTPALNALYALDPQSQFNLTGISTGIASGKGLPGGGSTFLYNSINFTAAEFLSVASALENYVYGFTIALATIVESGGAIGSLPVTPLVIA